MDGARPEGTAASYVIAELSTFACAEVSSDLCLAPYIHSVPMDALLEQPPGPIVTIFIASDEPPVNNNDTSNNTNNTSSSSSGNSSPNNKNHVRFLGYALAVSSPMQRRDIDTYSGIPSIVRGEDFVRVSWIRACPATAADLRAGWTAPPGVTNFDEVVLDVSKWTQLPQVVGVALCEAIDLASRTAAAEFVHHHGHHRGGRGMFRGGAPFAEESVGGGMTPLAALMRSAAQRAVGAATAGAFPPQRGGAGVFPPMRGRGFGGGGGGQQYGFHHHQQQQYAHQQQQQLGFGGYGGGGGGGGGGAHYYNQAQQFFPAMMQNMFQQHRHHFNASYGGGFPHHHHHRHHRHHQHHQHHHQQQQRPTESVLPEPLQQQEQQPATEQAADDTTTTIPTGGQQQQDAGPTTPVMETE